MQGILRKGKAHFGVKSGVPAPLKGRRFALWGLAFKADTDDIRESMALELIEGLVNLGAEVVVHDFAAMDAVKARWGAQVRDAISPLETCEGADALFTAAAWAHNRGADLEAGANALKARRIFDGRNLFRPEAMEAKGWTYLSLGRRAVVAP